LHKVDIAIGVCQALVDRMKNLQPNLKQAITIRNGVDTSLFYPEPEREQLRAQLGYRGYCLLSVGNLVAVKCQDKIISLLTKFDDVQLYIVGDGPLEQQLKAQVQQLNLTQRVHFIGYQSQAQLRQHYTAADCMVLASNSEGWANVLLEAMACGCPVVATPAGGTPEVIAHPHAGVVSKDFSVESLLSALLTLKQNAPAREDVSAYARALSWDQSITLLKQTFDKVLQQRSNSAADQREQHVR
jgi:glycosyltransferase involved in cell wall biosynthesis